MKTFTKGSDYAVRILIYLAQNAARGMIASTTVAKELGIPIAFLRRIYSKLIKGGLLEASEGAQGGAKLAREPESISVLDVIELIQGPIEMSECVYRNKPCPNRKTCGLRCRIKKIEKLVAEEFGKITIAEMTGDR